MAMPIYSAHDARRRAKRRLPRSVFEFVEGGNEARDTVHANVDAFRNIGFVPRVSSARETPTTTRTVLGTELSMPVITSPAGFIRIVHPAGETAVARAGARAGIATGLSILASEPVEKVVAANPNTWFQLYMVGGREGTKVAVERAKLAGVKVLIITVDLAAGTGGSDARRAPAPPAAINVRSAMRHAHELALHPRWAASFAMGGLDLIAPNAPGTDGTPMTVAEGSKALRSHIPTWDDIAYVRELWDGPFLVKGLADPRDALRAADVGVDGVCVSNHGGNGLDGAPATLNALPAVVDAVGERVEVLMDGGVRRGGDVVKALALGARAVLIGRPFVWSLAARGEKGVDEYLALVQRGLTATMQLIDVNHIDDLSPDVLRR